MTATREGKFIWYMREMDDEGDSFEENDSKHTEL